MSTKVVPLELAVIEQQSAQAVVSGREWPQPDLRILGDYLPPAPPCPFLPGRWGEWVIQAAEAKACAPDYVLASLLVGAAGLIGNARRAAVWPEWTEPCVLWALLIGPPSSGKSPAVDAMRSILIEIEADMAQDFPSRLADFERAKEVAEIRRDAWREAARKKPDQPPPPIPADALPPEQPQRPRIVVTDVTIERVSTLAAANEKGLVYAPDEAAAWLGNMERRGGNDQPFWLACNGGRPTTVDRQKHPALLIPHLSVSVLSTAQPDIVRRHLLDTIEDGLASRFLCVYPDKEPAFHAPRAMPDREFAMSAARRLHGLALAPAEVGAPRPVAVPFTDEAKQAMEQWGRGLQDKARRMEGRAASYVGKLRGCGARLALILEFLAWSETGLAEPMEIKASSFDLARALVDDYFLPMAMRVFGGGGLTEVDHAARKVAAWLLANRSERINLRGLQRTPGFPVRNTNLRDRAILALCDAHWLRPCFVREGTTPGRMAKDYEVSPFLPFR